VAGVSKQTVYNRFASKLEIAQAMANQRSDAIVAPLKEAGEPAAVLEALAPACWIGSVIRTRSARCAG
jgi:TetR/AcrR family transcriptional regulator, mexJK operon transcriptional repressor